jgi:hypothetical protein
MDYHREVPGLTRKQRGRRRKLRAQWERRRRLAEAWEGRGNGGNRVAPSDDAMACARASAFGAIKACRYLARQGVIGFSVRAEHGEQDRDERDRAREKTLSAFYHQAYKGEVDAHVVACAAEAYVGDKFERRVDSTCCLLHAARLSGFGVPPAATLRRRRVRVASIGGGPGNDAVGYVLYNRQQPRPGGLLPPTRIDVTVFDFCPEWEPIVRSVGTALAATGHAASQYLGGNASDQSWFREASQRNASAAGGALSTSLLDVRFDFRLADLTAHTSSAVNTSLLQAVPDTDVFLFSNVCHETRAWEHTMLPEILRNASPGALFLFVDLWRKDLELVRQCIATNTEAGHYDKVQFLGTTRAFPFKALAAQRSDRVAAQSPEKKTKKVMSLATSWRFCVLLAPPSLIALAFALVFSMSATPDPAATVTTTLPFTVQGSVQRMRWEDRHQVFPAKTRGFGSRPIVFTGSPVERWDAVQKWSAEYLSSFLDLKLRRVTDLGSGPTAASPHGNIPASYVYPNPKRPLAKLLGARETFEEMLVSRGQRRVDGGMLMPEFWATRCKKNKNKGTTSASSTTTVVQGWRGDFEALAHDLGDSSSTPGNNDATLDWMRMTPDARSRHQIWMACRGATTQMHYDHSPNFVAQIVGHKEFLLAPPATRIPIFPRIHPWYSFSVLGIVGPPAATTTTTTTVPVLNATLASGDLLFVPPFWWHHVTALTTAVGLNKFSSTGHLEAMLDAALPNALHDTTAGGTPRRWLLAWKFLEYVVSRGMGPGPGEEEVKAGHSVSQNIFARDFLRDVYMLRYAPLLSGLSEKGHAEQLDERCHGTAERAPSYLSPTDDRACGQSFGLLKSMTEERRSTRTLESVLTVNEMSHVEEHIVGMFRAFPYAAGGGARRLLLADYVEDLLAYVVGPKKVCWFLLCTGAA